MIMQEREGEERERKSIEVVYSFAEHYTLVIDHDNGIWKRSTCAILSVVS
jgi:hypothetical protein